MSLESYSIAFCSQTEAQEVDRHAHSVVVEVGTAETTMTVTRRHLIQLDRPNRAPADRAVPGDQACSLAQRLELLQATPWAIEAIARDSLTNKPGRQIGSVVKGRLLATTLELHRLRAAQGMKAPDSVERLGDEPFQA